MSSNGHLIRRPRLEDAAAIWRLASESRVLEQNSCYAYLLLCQHFGDTCLIAEKNDQLVAFVAAYRPPTNPDVVFVWQIGVHGSERGKGLGSALLDRLVKRPACSDVRYLEATVSPSNGASERLFSGFARRHSTSLERTMGFSHELFAGTEHEDEELFRIGPLRR